MDKFFPPCVLLILSTLAGCASAPKTTPATAPVVTPEPKTEELSQSEQIQRLREKITDLETRIGALNEKINLENGAVTKEIAKESATKGETARPELPDEVVKPSAAAAKVVPTSKTSVKFVSDDNVDRYREAKIQYDAGRYADATVDFVAFTKDSPDHPLAPAAQYFIGMGYLKQKEFGRAEEELNRGLVAYPHSNYVPDTLVALLEIAVATKKESRVTYYQQKLNSTFPNSPQALRATLLMNAPQTEAAREEKIATRPELVEKPQAPEAPVAPAAGEHE